MQVRQKKKKAKCQILMKPDKTTVDKNIYVANLNLFFTLLSVK